MFRLPKKHVEPKYGLNLIVWGHGDDIEYEKIFSGEHKEQSLANEVKILVSQLEEYNVITIGKEEI